MHKYVKSSKKTILKGSNYGILNKVFGATFVVAMVGTSFIQDSYAYSNNINYLGSINEVRMSSSNLNVYSQEIRENVIDKFDLLSNGVDNIGDPRYASIEKVDDQYIVTIKRSAKNMILEQKIVADNGVAENSSESEALINNVRFVVEAGFEGKLGIKNLSISQAENDQSPFEIKPGDGKNLHTKIRLRLYGENELYSGYSHAALEFSDALVGDYDNPPEYLEIASDNTENSLIARNDKNYVGTFGAGIGGGKGHTGNNIIISGGTIEAGISPYIHENKGYSELRGAGIGGGGNDNSYISDSNKFNGRSKNVNAENIRITGGIVHIKPGSYGAGIGAGGSHTGNGEYSNAKHIVITGGILDSEQGEWAALIGGGNNGNGEDIQIRGGVLDLKAAFGGAAIGGGYRGDGIDILITGNTKLSATGGLYHERLGNSMPATIGGGMYGDGKNIIISGGDIEATNQMEGAAIGGGTSGNAENITISGGKIKSTSLSTGAAIGGGESGSAKNIKITGGYIEAYGALGAAIGGGDGGSASDINISGGEVIAIVPNGIHERLGYYHAAAIGGGFCGNGDNIHISGGRVTAIGRRTSSAIGGSYYQDNKNAGKNISISGGTVTVFGDGSDSIGRGGEFDDLLSSVIITGGSVHSAVGTIHAKMSAGDSGYLVPLILPDVSGINSITVDSRQYTRYGNNTDVVGNEISKNPKNPNDTDFNYEKYVENISYSDPNFYLWLPKKDSYKIRIPGKRGTMVMKADKDGVLRMEYIIPDSSYISEQVYRSENKFGQNEIPQLINNQSVESLRTAGLDRIGTSILVSQKYFDTSDYVIVASAKDFPDALTASVLSKNLRCPILLSNPNNLNMKVSDEIRRLKARKVLVVGGKNSVSDNVINELSNLKISSTSDRDNSNKLDTPNNISVRRISGLDRYETSTKIAEEVFNLTNKRDAVVLASGQLFPDSLSVGALASKMDRPILLLKRDSAPKSVQSFLANNNINKFLISGGYNTISDQAINHIYDLVENRDSDNQDMNNDSGINLPKTVEVERVSGNNRYETSLKITQRMMDEISKIDPSVKSDKNGKIFIVSGENFADALVIGGIAGMNDQGIILTQKNVPAKGSELANTNDAIRNFIKNTVKYVDVVGGKNTVSDNVLLQLLK